MLKAKVLLFCGAMVINCIDIIEMAEASNSPEEFYEAAAENEEVFVTQKTVPLSETTLINETASLNEAAPVNEDDQKANEIPVATLMPEDLPPAPLTLSPSSNSSEIFLSPVSSSSSSSFKSLSPKAKANIERQINNRKLDIRKLKTIEKTVLDLRSKLIVENPKGNAELNQVITNVTKELGDFVTKSKMTEKINELAIIIQTLKTSKDLIEPMNNLLLLVEDCRADLERKYSNSRRRLSNSENAERDELGSTSASPYSPKASSSSFLDSNEDLNMDFL